jgi:hypothetical protein
MPNPSTGRRSLPRSFCIVPDEDDVYSDTHGLERTSDSDWHEPSFLVNSGSFIAEEKDVWYWPANPHQCIGLPDSDSLLIGIFEPKIHMTLKALRRERDASPIRPNDEVAKLFDEYRSNWQRDTIFFSNISEKIHHEDYQRIIGLGLQALPHILSALESEPDDWFWALFSIVGIDVAAGERTVQDAAVAWVRWGRELGYLD